MPATKDDIAGKFLELALRFGYRRTTISDVATSLRISKKTVYDFFESKDELLAYALGLAARAQRARVQSTLTAPTVLGRIEQVVSIALQDVRRFYESNPHAEMLEPDELAERINQQVFLPMVRDLIVEGVASGEFELPDVEYTAAFAYAIGMEAVRIIREDTAQRPEAAALESLRRLVAGKVEGGGAHVER